MTHIDIFTGIGGFSLAASWIWDDHHILTFCEIDEFCQQVLKKHWPDVPCVPDVHDLRGENFGTVDLFTAGYPCQPFSRAGQQRGKDDHRFLWPEVCRLVSEIKPRWIVCENVVDIDGVVLDDMLIDLESLNYEVAPPFEIPACAVNAPHKRTRCFVVAHANGARLEGIHQARDGKYLQRSETVVSRHKWEARPRVLRRGHGLPDWMDRIRSLGNAVVPQVVAVLLGAIQQVDEGMRPNNPVAADSCPPSKPDKISTVIQAGKSR